MPVTTQQVVICGCCGGSGQCELCVGTGTGADAQLPTTLHVTLGDNQYYLYSNGWQLTIGVHPYCDCISTGSIYVGWGNEYGWVGAPFDIPPAYYDRNTWPSPPSPHPDNGAFYASTFTLTWRPAFEACIPTKGQPYNAGGPAAIGAWVYESFASYGTCVGYSKFMIVAYCGNAKMNLQLVWFRTTPGDTGTGTGTDATHPEVVAGWGQTFTDMSYTTIVYDETGTGYEIVQNTCNPVFIRFPDSRDFGGGNWTQDPPDQTESGNYILRAGFEFSDIVQCSIAKLAARITA